MSEVVTSDSELEPGDHVQIDRGLYSHSGIYVGDGKIIHVTKVQKSESQGNKCSPMTGPGTAIIRRDDLSDVARGDTVYKNNSLDTYHRPRQPSEIVETARQYVDKEIPYNVVTNNCETFATSMRNGVSRSKQVETVFTGLTNVAYKAVQYFKGTEN